MNTLTYKNAKLHTVLFCGLLAIIAFACNLFSQGPVVHGDEVSYFANAAAIAGYSNTMASSYHSGYSFLISPAFLLASDPHHVWTAIKAINALLYFFMLLGLTRIAKILWPNSSQKSIYAAVTLVALYPFWVAAVGYSFAQIAFIPLYILVVLLFDKALKTANLLHWLILGLCAGLLFWIHPTALPVYIAILLTLVLHSWRIRNYLPLIIVAITIAIMAFFYTSIVSPFIQQKMTVSGQTPNLHYPSTSYVLLKIFSWKQVLAVMGGLGGQFTYFAMGTGGLVIVGCISLFKSAFTLKSIPAKQSLQNSENQRAILSLFLLLAFLGMLAMSIITMSGGTRFDHWLYGRYTEAVLAPILLASIMNGHWRKALWAIPIIAIGATLWGQAMDSFDGLAPIHISAMWQVLAIYDLGIWLWIATGAMFIAAVALMPRKIAPLVIAGLFILSSYYQLKYHRFETQSLQKRWSHIEQIRDSTPVNSCVGFEFSGDHWVKSYYWLDSNFILYDYKLAITNSEYWYKNCDGPLLSYNRELLQNENVSLISQSTHKGPPLWVKK